MKSTIFMRGQVWYWEDPIYGRKENALDVQIGETTYRYSRYCIIAETTDSISNNSVMVIPCSTSLGNITNSDVIIPIQHLFNSNYTYAKVKSIFPVHVKYLKNYVCTLPDKCMRQIELELLKILIPTVAKNYDESELFILFNIDFKLSNDNYSIISKNPINHNVEMFTKNRIIFTYEDSDILTLKELKQLYDEYCKDNNIPIMNDIIEFADNFGYIVNKNFLKGKVNYNNIVCKGVKIADNTTYRKYVYDNINDDFTKNTSNISDTAINDDKISSSRWDDEDKIKFLNFYSKYGCDPAAKEFNLKSSTSQHYWYKWRKELNYYPQENTSNDNNVNECNETSDDDYIKISYKDNVNKAINKISNMICSTLKDDNVFSFIGYVYINGNDVSMKTFYTELKKVIYYSLLDFLNIKQVDHKYLLIPNLGKHAQNINTFHFIDKVYNDKRLLYLKTGKDVVEKYRNLYDCYGGLDTNWINNLKTRLNEKFELTDIAANIICDYSSCIYSRIPELSE